MAAAADTGGITGNLTLYGAGDCRDYIYKGHTYKTYVDFPVAKVTKGSPIYTKLSKLMVKSIGDLASSPDGLYTWLFVKNQFYAKQITSGMEVFGKHNQLIKIMFIDHPELFTEYKGSYEEYVERDLPVDNFFSGELKKDGNYITFNLYSGTYMLKTKERAAVSLGVDKDTDVDELRYNIFITKVAEQLETYSLIPSYTTGVLLTGIGATITDSEMELIREFGGEPYLFADREDCKTFANYDMKVLLWNNKREQQARIFKMVYKMEHKMEITEEELKNKLLEWDKSNPIPVRPSKVSYEITETRPLTKGYYYQLRYLLRGNKTGGKRRTYLVTKKRRSYRRLRKSRKSRK